MQLIIGLLWLMDGFLQLQPKLFTDSFMTQVIRPIQAGQPSFAYEPINLAIRLFLTHPAFFNLLIALVQLTIGLLIIYPKATRVGLWLSVIWGLIVWFFGEALGGLMSGHSSLMFGLPGAALIYVILSLAIMPPQTRKNKPKNQFADSWLVFAWAIIWMMGAIYQLLPAQKSISMLAAMIKSNASGAPGWLASLDYHLASYLNHLSTNSHQLTNMNAMMVSSSAYLVMLALAGVMFVIAVGVFMGKYMRIAVIILGIILSLAFWLFGQSLAGYYTGLMTDVNTSPLIILLGLSVIGQPDMDKKLKLYYQKLEVKLT